MEREFTAPIWLRPRRFIERASPGPLLFMVAIILLVLGLIFPILTILFKIGLFIIIFFVVLLVVGIILQMLGGAP